MADDSELTDEERTAVNHAWRNLIEDRAHGGKLHYTMPDVRGMAPPGAYKIPKDVVAHLGHGSLHDGGFVLHSLFGTEDTPEDPTVIHPHVVRIIGNGNLNAGRRVLEKFVARVRRQPRNDSIEQPDGNSPSRVIR